MLKDENGVEWDYALLYMERGWDEEVYSNSFSELDNLAKEMTEKNNGKPLIIVNKNDDIAKEFTKRHVPWGNSGCSI